MFKYNMQSPHNKYSFKKVRSRKIVHKFADRTNLYEEGATLNSTS